MQYADQIEKLLSQIKSRVDSLNLHEKIGDRFDSYEANLELKFFYEGLSNLKQSTKTKD